VTESLLRKLLRAAAGRRLRHGVRTFVQSSSLYDLPVSQCEPGNSRVAVLAPHMDDEVLGCGGTIARHVAAGSSVTVIFLTDGRRGGGKLTSQDGRPADPDRVVSVRKAEAQRAAQVLGIRDVIFLDAEDSRLGSDTRVASRLREILERMRPEIVYVPFFLERHPDHRAASGVLLEATRAGGLSFECRGYEVWTPLFPNCVVRIDATVQLKQQALRCYESQLTVMDYMHSGMGLNAYRAMSCGTPAARFAEAFHAAALADYRRLCASFFNSAFR
jgi:LmbE family N-acetylglucosaminyl deacetylase